MDVLDAAYALAHHYPGGAHALGPRLGMSGKLLANKLNPNDKTHHLMLSEAVLMQSLTGDHRILMAECEQLGYVAIPRPDASLVDDDIAHALSAACGQFGDYLRKVDDSMKDGRITPTERRALERELSEMIAAAEHLQALLAAKSIAPTR